MSVTVRTSKGLLMHLAEHSVDGTTVADSLFDFNRLEGAQPTGIERLSYPGRQELEFQLGHFEPYTLNHEARVIEGLPVRVRAAVRWLADTIPHVVYELDPTLALLWSTHAAWKPEVSIDRLVAAMVAAQAVVDDGCNYFGALEHRMTVELIEGMRSIGFPLCKESIEEICDGAEPCCLGLDLVEL